MKKIVSLLLIGACLCATLSSCSTKKNEEIVKFSLQNEVNSSFGGLGVEWGVYEDTNKLISGAREKITAAADRLRPAIVRCMTNLDWIVTDFDTHGTEAHGDDTWRYNFDNKYMHNACEILDYCETHGIEVAFGVWNVLGRADNSDGIGMIFEGTSDERWAAMIADLMEYLMKDKGYTCIKWFVNTNEPNYYGVKGTSKNAYGSYDKWEKGAKQVRAALDGVGLQSVDIVGTDVTFTTNGSAMEYLTGVARNQPAAIGNYGIHLYVNDLYIINGTFGEQLRDNIATIRAIDGEIMKEKPVYVWETGLLDGKNAETDCNSFIANYSYGLRMADLTVQCLLEGVDGISYWDFDDAMHFMYLEGGTTAKEWGMFSTLNDASPLRQEYRPWYHSSVLLTNLLTKGSRIYAPENTVSDSFRTLAVVSADGKDSGFVAVNRSAEPVTQVFDMTEIAAEKKDTLYVYIFNEKSLRLDENGFVTYNYTISAALTDGIEIEIPAGSMLIVSDKEL